MIKMTFVERGMHIHVPVYQIFWLTSIEFNCYAKIFKINKKIQTTFSIDKNKVKNFNLLNPYFREN